jgi:hypothetical protein
MLEIGLKIKKKAKVMFYGKRIGVMQYNNGDEYNGEWSGGYAKGIGVMLYRNGDRYEGEWLENKRNGKGFPFSLTL